jgi:hypothetical protein
VKPAVREGTFSARLWRDLLAVTTMILEWSKVYGLDPASFGPLAAGRMHSSARRDKV